MHRGATRNAIAWRSWQAGASVFGRMIQLIPDVTP